MDLLYDLMFLIREILQPRPETLYDLVFRTREFLQPRPDTSKACVICCSKPVRHVVDTFSLVFGTSEILKSTPDT